MVTDLIPCNLPIDKDTTYSPFERFVLYKLRELNVMQDVHYKFCNGRFQDLDD